MKNRTRPTNRYALYLRCSTDDQAHGDFTTIDAQESICRRFVAEHGGHVAALFSDDGKTGTNLKRQGFKDLLRDAQAGLFDIALCTYMSRLGRGDAQVVAEWQLREAGVAVEYVKERFTDDLIGYGNKQLTRLVDGMYAKQVSEWTRTKLSEMFEQGYWPGGAVPFGYRLKSVPGLPPRPGKHGEVKPPPKRLTVDEAAAPHVPRAFELAIQTRGVAASVEYLRTHCSAQSWSHTRMLYLLQNRVYLGEMWRRGRVREGSHPALVAPEVFAAAQAALSLRGARRRAYQPKQNSADDFAFLLRGSVFCDACGGRMSPAGHHGRQSPVRYYECIQATKFKNRACPVVRVNATLLHGAVAAEIARLGHPWRARTVLREALAHIPRDAELEREAASIARQIRAAEKKAAGLADAIALAAGTSAGSALVERLSAVQGERDTLGAEAARLAEALALARAPRVQIHDLARVFGKFNELWTEATDGERERILTGLGTEVRMTGKQKGNLRIWLSCGSPIGNVGTMLQKREDNGT